MLPRPPSANYLHRPACKPPASVDVTELLTRLRWERRQLDRLIASMEGIQIRHERQRLPKN